MNRRTLPPFLVCGFLLTRMAFAAAGADAKKYDFPVYKNRPIGRQLAGAHAPATTPALTPDEAQKKFTLPEGFEIRLFASEPEVVNPVAMTWDDRGRLWVLELYEYPLGAKAGEKPRDRIKILEDTDADGHADTVKVFADGLNLATGLLLGYGGVFVGQAPHFLFLRDTDGDARADTREPLLTGFGLEDRHELLNGFTWGPDGYLYMTHGVFTHSKVKDPDQPRGEPVVLTAGVARFHPRTKKFEVFAEGTSNPWGVDFDRFGNAFVSACVIEHLFHLVPGGIYDRQAGQAPHPYAYELLHAINDHKHHMAAYSGVHVYQGDLFPSENLGTILQGNLHDNSIHQDMLKPNGSSFTASKWRDLVRANDGWFLPVSIQVGPDGAVWIMDWYDRYPCYQNANADPEGVDREHGRIWRVVYVGNQKGRPVPSRPRPDMNLARLSSEELVPLLAHPNAWHRRTAQRLISERRDLPNSNTLHQETTLHKMMKDGPTLAARLAAFWTLHTSGALDEEWVDKAVEDREPALRAWAARLIGERGFWVHGTFERLEKLARDPDPTVRLAVAVAARQFVSGALTVNTPPAVPIREAFTGGILSSLWFSSFDAKDPVIPFMYWMALEPIIAFDPVHALGFYQEDGATKAMPLAGILLTKIMRRVCDLRDEAVLTRALLAFEKIPAQATPTLLAGLRGLIEGQRGNALVPNPEAVGVISRLAKSTDGELAKAAQQVAAQWGDASALKATLTRALDTTAPEADRSRAIQTARKSKSDSTRDAMLQLVARQDSERVQIEALGALSEIGGDSTGYAILDRWKQLAPAARRAAADALNSRGQWRGALFGGLEGGAIQTGDLSTSLIRSLVNHREEAVRQRALKVIGRYRDTDADKLKLIAEKRKVVLSGEPDLTAGHEVALKTCLTCHKLHGEGAEVGPDLTGVGRSSLDTLLANVIDPNQIIGAGYENVEVETKDGRTVSGRLMENTDTRVRLLAQGPKEEVVAKSDIASLRVSEVSVMPEGLEQMPDADFRNLIWYILNPPQDNRPLTPEVRKQLIGEDKPSASVPPPTDKESVALWNPEWRVICPDFEGAPAKLADYAGRKNVLMTHPFDAQRGAVLERIIELPAGQRATLSFFVAAHAQGDWELRVLANDQLLKKQLIDKSADRWRQITVDLTPFAGKKVVLRLENGANNWSWEFGYWADVELKIGEQLQAGK